MYIGTVSKAKLQGTSERRDKAHIMGISWRVNTIMAWTKLNGTDFSTMWRGAAAWGDVLLVLKSFVFTRQELPGYNILRTSHWPGDGDNPPPLYHPNPTPPPADEAVCAEGLERTWCMQLDSSSSGTVLVIQERPLEEGLENRWWLAACMVMVWTVHVTVLQYFMRL